MQIATTIIPIFLVVILGWIVHQLGFIPKTYLEPANRLVYYIAIPPMVFMAITKSNAREGFNLRMIALTLAAVLLGYMAAWAISRVLAIGQSQRGTFIQCSGHANWGYIGLAVVYYYLGDRGLAQAGVIAGFIMVLQNVLSVAALQFYRSSRDNRCGIGIYIGRLMANPIIISVILAIVVSAFGIRIPIILQRTFSILGGLALPTALLIIGASLSVKQIRSNTKLALVASVIKLLILPGFGWLLFQLCRIDSSVYLPGLILLASPTATVSYVMSKELDGDADLAAAAISASTLLSAITLMVYL